MTEYYVCSPDVMLYQQILSDYVHVHYTPDSLIKVHNSFLTPNNWVLIINPTYDELIFLKLKCATVDRVQNKELSYYLIRQLQKQGWPI